MADKQTILQVYKYKDKNEDDTHTFQVLFL